MNNHVIVDLFESLLYMLEPIKWENIYIPFLPFHLVSNLEAIQSYLVGMSKIHMDYVGLPLYRWLSTTNTKSTISSYSTSIKIFLLKRPQLPPNCPSNSETSCTKDWLLWDFVKILFWVTYSEKVEKWILQTTKSYWQWNVFFLMVSSISLTTIGPLLLSKKETFLVLTEMATSLYFPRRANGHFLLNS